MQRHQVGRGLYACVQEWDGLGSSNSGLVVDGSGLVVDARYDPVLTAAMADLDAALGIELGPYAAWTEPERLARSAHLEGRR